VLLIDSLAAAAAGRVGVLEHDLHRERVGHL
jgi:hypothetical protein